jgi:periplasmic protein TonB
MKEILTIIFICLLNFETRAQPCAETRIVNSDTIFVAPEKAPYSEQGLELYMAWISNHMNPKLRGYGQEKPRVFVGFVVNENGRISDFEVIKGLGDPYDKEAIKLIKNHPHKWIPGECGSRKVKTRIVLPVRFNASQ